MSTLNKVTPATAYVASSAASIYTNGAGVHSYIKGVLLFNGNTSAETVKLYNVPNSGGSLGTAGVGNQIAELTINAKDSVFFPLNLDGLPLHLSGTNDAIFATTTTASKVTQTVFVETD